jgi:toxin HigB-1
MLPKLPVEPIVDRAKNTGDLGPSLQRAWRLTLIARGATMHWMIRSFRDKETERLFLRERRTKIASTLRRPALRKLLLLDAAETLGDVRVPPGNRREKLEGDRAGQYGIRVNDQWRVCFRWEDDEAHDVEIADDH